MVRLDHGFFFFGVLVLVVVAINEELRAEPPRPGATETGQIHIPLVSPPMPRPLQQARVAPAILGAASAHPHPVGLNDRPVYCFQVPSAGIRVSFVSVTRLDGLYLSGHPGNVAHRSTYRRLPAFSERHGQPGDLRLNVRAKGRRQLAHAPNADDFAKVVQPN
jgi:hypothetical protein